MDCTNAHPVCHRVVVGVRGIACFRVIENLLEIVPKRLCRVDPGSGLKAGEEGRPPLVIGGHLTKGNNYCLPYNCSLNPAIVDPQHIFNKHGPCLNAS